MHIATVNGLTTQTGCYIAGSWGQYSLDRLADVCEQFGVPFPEENDPRRWRKLMDLQEAKGGDTNAAFESLVDSADKLETLLNDCTENGVWHWDDGEFFLSPPDEFEEDS